MNYKLGILSLILGMTLSVVGVHAAEGEKEDLPRDAIPSNTAEDREHTIDGFFVQIGPAGGLEIGEERFLDPGPGIHAGVGYIWDPVWLCGTVQWLRLEPDNLPEGSECCDIDYINFNADLLIFPMQKSDFFLQPYFIVGPGYYHLNLEESDAHVNGFGGSLGLGLNIHLTEHFALGLENSFHPVLWVETDTPGDDETEDAYFYTFAGFASFFF